MMGLRIRLRRAGRGCASCCSHSAVADQYRCELHEHNSMDVEGRVIKNDECIPVEVFESRADATSWPIVHRSANPDELASSRWLKRERAHRHSRRSVRARAAPRTIDCTGGPHTIDALIH